MAFVDTGSTVHSTNHQSTRLLRTGPNSSPLSEESSPLRAVRSETSVVNTSDWLKRFQELCSWQRKQQETLLSQQQLQLEKLKREQQQVHSQLAAQRQTRHPFSHADHVVGSKEDVEAGDQDSGRHEQAVVREIQVESETGGLQSEADDLKSRRQDVCVDDIPESGSLQVDEDSEDKCGESPLKNENSGGLSDDRPLSPAISGVTGNFDAFVEQQLRLEHQARVSGVPVGTQKRQHTFLRKGQGLQRFKIQGLSGKQNGHLKLASTVSGDDSGLASEAVESTQEKVECTAKSSTPEESFFVRTNQRQEVEKEELEEFELMEQLADQSSFSSQCSLAKKVMTTTSKQQDKEHSDSETDDNEIAIRSQDATLTGDETQDDDSVSSVSDVQSIESDPQPSRGLTSTGQLSSHAIGVEFDDEDTWEELRPNSYGKFNPLTSTPPVKTLVARQRKVYRPSKRHTLDSHESSNKANYNVFEYSEQPKPQSDVVEIEHVAQSTSEEDGDSTLVSDSLHLSTKPNGFLSNKIEHNSAGFSVHSSAVSPPPTSTLVTKLFPSLDNGRVQVKQSHQQSPAKVSRPVSVVREVGLAKGDEMSAMAVKQKLVELETEIERFKRENLAVVKLKEEREKALKELAQARVEFDRWKSEEVSQFEVYKEEELKKIRHEKRVFEQYRMAVQNAPDRREREEITTLTKENSELRGELEKRESRWAAANERYRGKISALERENSELKQELNVMEEQRLTQWMKQFESRSNGEQLEQVKQPKQKQLINQSPATLRQSTHVDQRDKHEEKTLQSTGIGRKKGDTKSSRQAVQTRGQKSHAKSPKKGSDLMSGNRSVQFSDKSGTSSEEASQETKSVDLKSEGVNGNDHSIEHPDGRVEVVKADGSKTIKYPNGTKKDVSADGLSIVLSFFNGDVKRISPDQKVVYYYAETKTQQTTYPDGLEVMEFSSGQIEKQYPDGTKEVIFPDHTVKYLFADGSQESVFTSGIIQRVSPNSDVTIEHPNGQLEIHTTQFKRREYPDGTVKTVFCDGRQETRYSSGRLRVKDSSGRVVVDTVTTDFSHNDPINN